MPGRSGRRSGSALRISIQPNNPMTILTVIEAAELLKMKPTQLYSMTKKRGRARMKKPIPVIKINGSLRFAKESLENWLKELECAA
jgi:predicted DNA-binding transcriptional regulator AlpA